MSTVRADQLLVERGLDPTRSAAQRLIKAGAVHHLSTVIGKAGALLEEDAQLTVIDDAELRYVSRAGLKLEGLLNASGINPQDKVCLDIGSSTGGFSDCLLQRGAKHIVGIEVGHDQLHARLRNDPRITNCEGINARYLTREDLPLATRGLIFDLAVVDVSFISLKLVLPAVLALLSPQALLIALVKPQFELGKAALNKEGRPTDLRAYDVLRQDFIATAEVFKLSEPRWFDSPITGQDGNREFFLLATT